MRFALEVECEGAAFDGDDATRTELPRMLRYVADRLELNTWGPILDVYGNVRGSYDLIDDEPEA